MNCDDLREHMPDFLAGGISPEARAEVEAHLAACGECRQDAEMWAHMGAWPDQQPGPALRERFDALLAAYRSGFDHAERGVRPRFTFGAWIASWWPAQPAIQLTILVLALGAGWLGGYGAASRSSSRLELAKLQEEVHRTREMVAVSLLQQSSASERLRGVSWSYQVNRPDTDVLGALIHAVKYDTSVDVRLAAADALRRYSSDAAVRQGVLEALRPPQSPLVQIALIDWIVETHFTGAGDALRELGKDTGVDPVVRRRVEWGLQHL